MTSRPREPDGALVRNLEPGEHAQDRALSAPGSAEQDEQLARLDFERNAVHDDLALAVALADVFERDGHQASLLPV